jgi:hypothetical protein
MQFVEHIAQLTNRWEMVQATHLDPNLPDSISWKLTNDGSYSSKTAYKMQFLGQPTSPFSLGGLEALGTSEMQVLRLVDDPK